VGVYSKYYGIMETFLFFFLRGSSLARRMRDRELEIQSDARDKHREMEEIEEVLRKQMSGETAVDNNKLKRHTNSIVAASLSSKSSGYNKENEVSISLEHRLC
jgi:hypothetical protein